MSQQLAKKDPGKGPATELGKLLNERGRLLKKEFHEFAKLRAYSTTLTVNTLIFSFPRSDTNRRIFGVKLDQESEDSYDESAFLDFDEMEEMLRAIKFLYEVAMENEGKHGEYSEYIYSTKDEVQVGFFQTQDGEQRAFFDVEPGGGMLFLSFEQLREVFDGLKRAYQYLLDSGAS